MKARTAILLVVIVCLLSGSVALAQSDEPPSAAQYVMTQGAASGGIYHLTSQPWQVHGVAGNGAYRLTVPLSPTGTGTPCCCTYLPCLQR